MRDDLFLRVLFKGLFRELSLQAGIAKSLQLFLPYSVTYLGRNPADPIVRLIDPRSINIDKNVLPAAASFFSNRRNSAVIEKTKESGRRDCALWDLICQLNKCATESKTNREKRFFIHSEARGDKTYRMITQSLSPGASTSKPRKDEYDVSKFGNLYPTLAVITQEDFNVLGAISIDCSANIASYLETAFSEFMRDYHFLSAWEFNHCDLWDYYRRATNRWQSNADNPFAKQEYHSFNKNKWSSLYQSVQLQLRNELQETSWALILRLLSFITRNKQKHFILKCLYGDLRTCVALWKLLTIDPAIVQTICGNLPFHLQCLKLTGWKPETAVAFNIAAGCLLREMATFKNYEIAFIFKGPYTDIQFVATGIRWDSSKRELIQRIETERKKITPEGLLSYEPRNFSSSIAMLCQAVIKAWSEMSSSFKEYAPSVNQCGYYCLPKNSPSVYSSGHPVTIFAFDDNPLVDNESVDLMVSVRCPATRDHQ